MNLPPLFRKMLAEFIGVAVFLTAILGAGASFAASGGADYNVLHSASLAIALGLMVLLTGGVSGGHLNPAVSLYFYSKGELKLGEFLGYVVAQLAGAVAGVSLAYYLIGSGKLGFVATVTPAATNVNGAFAGEVLATAGLVWLIVHLVQNKLGNLIPFILMLWVFAASLFTSTGAQANPAVTFGLMFAGKLPVSNGLLIMIAEITGLILAMVIVLALTSGRAKKKAAARKPAAKK
jgi:glycerol uptake facilitator-like aquaporin